jgi:hypothetical protein
MSRIQFSESIFTEYMPQVRAELARWILRPGHTAKQENKPEIISEQQNPAAEFLTNVTFEVADLLQAYRLGLNLGRIFGKQEQARGFSGNRQVFHGKVKVKGGISDGRVGTVVFMIEASGVYHVRLEATDTLPEVDNSFTVCQLEGVKHG